MQGVALQTYALRQTPIATAAADVGVATLVGSKAINIVGRFSDALASGESAVVTVNQFDKEGTAVQVAQATFDDTNVTAAGEVVVSVFDTSALVPSTHLVQIDVVYTAGGGPNGPNVTFLAQLGQ
jgi:hypothetical protein